MCNNVVALGNATKDGSVIFGKNSDRETNEAHDLLYIPAREGDQLDDTVQCTYVEINQVEKTNAVLLAKPCWIWGGEIGANDKGVTIGNTAIFTRDKVSSDPGLIGMDFLRLALERTSTAEAAMECIIELLEEYGQGGNDGFAHKLYYHNSFLIADHNDAWVLETSQKNWVAKQVKDVAATSNSLTIGDDYTRKSKKVVSHAVKEGWCKDSENFSFKKSYGGPGLYVGYVYTFFGRGVQRQDRLVHLLNKNKGEITPKIMMDILRDHGANADDNWAPDGSLFENTVCMHAAWGPIRPDQTTGSMVSRLADDGQIHWLSGSASPCTSIFKPVWIDNELPDIGTPPTGRYNHTSLWWRHESLQRSLIQDYAHRMSLFDPERDEIENRYIDKAIQSAGLDAEKRRQLSVQCFEEADDMTEKWTKLWAKKSEEKNIKKRPGWFYRQAWKKFNKEASFVPGDPSPYTKPTE